MLSLVSRERFCTWNAKFPSPQNLISLLQSHKRNLISIIDPHVKATSGYFVYDEGKSEGRFVKTHDGSDFEGHCWPGKSSWTDFFDPEAGKWYAGLYSRAGLVSTDYTWNDMNEPSVFGAGEITFPRDLVHFGNLTNREVHNLYGHLMTQYTQMGHYARNNDQRSFILTRSFFAGTQRSAAMWTGDNIATWEHMRASIPMILSMSISGIGFAGADVGGFFDNKGRDYELFTRWHQLAALLPFYRAHSHKESNRKEPWSFDDIEPKTSKIIGRQIERRYLLSPHIYTLFRLHETNGGDPVMRPLWMEFPSDENALDIEDAFLLGSSVLVFPALHPSKSAIDFYVPHGPNDDREAWISMVDLSTFNGGQWYREPVPIDGYAYVLLKLGNIFPFKFRPRRSLLSTLGDPLTLFICPDWTGKAVGQVYVDNGVDMAYTRGHFVHRSFVFKNGVLKSTPYTKYKQPVLQNTTHGEWIERIVFCNHGPVVKTIKMTVIKSEKVSKTLQFEQTSGKYGNHLLVRKPGVRIEDDFVIEILH